MVVHPWCDGLMFAFLSLAAVGAAIASQSLLCWRTRLPSITAFLMTRTTCGLILLAGMLMLGRQLGEIVAALLVYAFVSELHLFVFTFAAASISANTLALLRRRGLPVEQLRDLYAGDYMARARIDRSEQAGLIIRSDVIRVTSAGQRISAVFSVARRFFDHDQVSNRPWTALIFLVSLAIFAFQIATVAFNGWTLTGVCEESLGYRYFYSLRAIYEPLQPLFLPQGQILDLYHRGLQVLLTSVGYPPTQLYPRINIFSYLSIFGMQILNAVCFAWMLQQVRQVGAKLCIAAVYLAAMFSTHFSFMYIFIQPDYMALELPILWLSIGAIFNTLDRKPFDANRILFFGFLLGFALSVKITLAAVPAAALLQAIISGGVSWRRTARGFVAACLATSLLALAWLAVARFNLSLLADYAHRFLAFLATGPGVASPTQNFFAWYASHLLSDDPASLAVFLTPILAAVLAGASRRLASITSILAAVSIFELYFLWKRDSPGTLMETAAPLLILLGILLRHAFEHESRKSRIAASALASIAMLIFGIPHMNGSLYYVEQNSRQQAMLPSPDGSERQIWLIPDNSVRPQSVHSAVLKGTLEGNPPLRPIMFPNFDYRFYDWIARPIELGRYDSIFFIQNGGLADTIHRIETFYRIGLTHCGPSSILSGETVIRCQPNF
jgi:hypothetical protein